MTEKPVNSAMPASANNRSGSSLQSGLASSPRAAKKANRNRGMLARTKVRSWLQDGSWGS